MSRGKFGLYTGVSVTVSSHSVVQSLSCHTRYIVNACNVLILDVFAQLARSNALSVAFCSRKNRSSLVIPNCDFACNGDTEAAAAMQTARMRAVHEFWFGIPISMFSQNRSKSLLNDGMCNTCASGLTVSVYLSKSASASIFVGNCGASTSLFWCIDNEPPSRRFSEGANDGICSADNSPLDCVARGPATEDEELGLSDKSLPSYAAFSFERRESGGL
jgi:hypothetical protein